MPPTGETNAAQGGMINSIKNMAQQTGARLGVIRSGGTSMEVPHVKELHDAVEALNGSIAALQTRVNNFSASHIVSEYGKIVSSAKAAATSSGGVVGATASSGSHTPAPSTPFGGPNNPVAQGRQGWTTTPVTAAGPSPAVAAAGGGGGIRPPVNNAPYYGGSPNGATPPAGSPGGGHSTMTGMATAYSAAGGGSAGLVAAGLSGIASGISKATDLLGAITMAGVQYTYNRIEGPTGNRNATMALSQGLAPLTATTGLSMTDLVKGLSQRTPALGSMSDIMGTMLAGNAVGAQVKGTPNRNGFFQGVREMQTLTPGIGAGALAGTLANYMGNTASQQMGAFYGQGAFTMIGQGGRYKTLGEWAQGITEFFKQQRPGSDRGKDFSKAELMAQNFPGSNVNAWFQMMGVPQDMVDYWWQYVLTKANSGATGKGPFDLQAAVRQQRGADLGAQRLETITQASRRDFLMGSQMYPAYQVKEEADKRFNVAMQRADMDVAKMATNTNVGMIMSMMPTSITDLLMPIITKLAGSKFGAAGSMIGMLKDTFGDVDQVGDVGDYGDYGGTSTAHLAPGLAKKVAAMQRANPRVRINSGYRDMFLQGRLGKKGVGRVSGKPSAHTKGWAADLGPSDQLGWINANAHKFGIQMASNQGEPWHAQEAGTMHVGDDMGGSSIADFVRGFMGTPFANTGGWSSGGFDAGGVVVSTGHSGLNDIINSAISAFIGLMLKPVMGLADLFGSTSFSDNDVSAIVGKPTDISLKLPRYKGFEPSSTSTGPDIFGDLPVRPTIPHFNVPLPNLNMSHGTSGAKTVIQVDVKVPITVAASGNETFDARRLAAVLEPHVEQAARRAMAAAGER